MKFLSSFSGYLNTMISPRFGSFQVKILLSVKGIRGPYTNLFTSRWSPTVSVGIIEPDGILNASTTNCRMNSATTAAIRKGSIHSL